MRSNFLTSAIVAAFIAVVGLNAQEEEGLTTVDSTRDLSYAYVPAHKNFVVDLGDQRPVGGVLPPPVLQFVNLITNKTGVTFDRINWDGKGVIDFLAGAEEKVLPRDFFLKGQNNNSTSKHIFTNAPNEKAEVANSSDAFTLPIDFGAKKGNKLTFTFTTDAQGTLGAVQSFGAIFLNVKRNGYEGIRYFDKHGKVLLNLRAKKNRVFQLVGAVFNSPVIWKAIVDFDSKHKASDIDDIFFDKTAVLATG